MKIFILVLSLGFASSAFAGSEKACFKVSGMTCGSCEMAITTAVKKLKGIKGVEVSKDKEAATVGFDSSKISSEEIGKAIEATGYTAVAKKCS